MASIQSVYLNSGDRRFRAQYRDVLGRQVVKQFKVRRDAQAWLDQAAHDRVSGTMADTKAGLGAPRRRAPVAHLSVNELC